MIHVIHLEVISKTSRSRRSVPVSSVEYSGLFTHIHFVHGAMNQSIIISLLPLLGYDLHTFRALSASQVPVASVNTHQVLLSTPYRMLIYTAEELAAFSKGSRR